MAKNREEQRRNDVEAAIRSLYDLFPEPKYSGGKTRAELDIEKEIAKRREQLDKDRKLLALEAKLKSEKASASSLIKKKRLQIDRILRSFRVRGESPTLLSAIENLSNENLVVFYGSDD